MTAHLTVFMNLSSNDLGGPALHPITANTATNIFVHSLETKPFRYGNPVVRLQFAELPSLVSPGKGNPLTIADGRSKKTNAGEP